MWQPLEAIPPEFKDGRKVIVWARPCGFPDDRNGSYVGYFNPDWNMTHTVNGEQVNGWMSDDLDNPSDLVPTHWQPWPEKGPD